MGPVGILEQTKRMNQKKKSRMNLDAGIDPGSIDSSSNIEEGLSKELIDKTKKLVKKNKVGIFDAGKEERKLIEVSRFLQGKIPDDEWDEISSTNQTNEYTVRQGETLWGISRKLFGSGFYYSKIWSLNPYITNPHEIEPGITLVLTGGSSEGPPEIKLGEFVPQNIKDLNDEDLSELIDFDYFGDETEPKWIQEKKELIKQGIFVQYASVNTLSLIHI